MLENLSQLVNHLDYFRLNLERCEFGVHGNIEIIEDNYEINEKIHAIDIYDFFVQLSILAEQNLDYNKFRKEYYGLCTIDKMEIVNDGLCFAASKAKRLIYKERYDTHCSFQSYFDELQNQITTYQDYYKPIYKLENYEKL